MIIIHSPRFIRQYKKLSLEVVERFEGKEDILRTDPFNQSLKTHKLHGELSEFWAFSVDYRIRVIFEFQDQNTIIFHDIGDHDVY